MTIRELIQFLADRLGIPYEQAQHISLQTAAAIMEPVIIDTTGEEVCSADAEP